MGRSEELERGGLAGRGAAHPRRGQGTGPFRAPPSALGPAAAWPRGRRLLVPPDSAPSPRQLGARPPRAGAGERGAAEGAGGGRGLVGEFPGLETPARAGGGPGALRGSVLWPWLPVCEPLGRITANRRVPAQGRGRPSAVGRARSAELTVFIGTIYGPPQRCCHIA